MSAVICLLFLFGLLWTVATVGEALAGGTSARWVDHAATFGLTDREVGR